MTSEPMTWTRRVVRAPGRLVEPRRQRGVETWDIVRGGVLPRDVPTLAQIPKPTIAMVHGACIGGALILAWACDLIIASDDTFFADPVVQMGMPGIEYFAHPWQMGSRFAKEFLFLGERIGASRAHELGMVNRACRRTISRPRRSTSGSGSPACPRSGPRWPSRP